MARETENSHKVKLEELVSENLDVFFSKTQTFQSYKTIVLEHEEFSDYKNGNYWWMIDTSQSTTR